MNNHNQEMCRDMERQQAGYEPAVEDGEDDGQDMLFDIEAEDGKFFPRAIGKGQRTPDYSDNQQRLLTFIKLTEPLQKLAEAVQQARCSSSKFKSISEVHLVAGELRNNFGFDVRLRTTCAGTSGTGYLRHLRHTFIVLCMLPGYEGTSVVVDLDFRTHFAVSRATPKYQALLDALPENFIGTVDTLAVVVSMMADAMKECFAKLRQPLPPWRESFALISKWLPDQYTDTAVPKQPRSALYLPPGSYASARSVRSSASSAARAAVDARRSNSGAGVTSKYLSAKVVHGFSVAPAFTPKAAAVMAGAEGKAGDAVAGAAGKLRVAANWEVLQKLLPPMRTVKLGAG